MKILVVEDDAETREFICQGLLQAGNTVSSSADGRDGLFKATEGGFDAVILDRMLPGLDGLSLLRMLRAARNTTPVLMLTAISSIADRVEGLEAGADDYLVKPFAFTELAARINALARRQGAQPELRFLRHDDIEIDLHRRLVQRAGQRIVLQPREFALLMELMQNADRVLTRTMLLERVWDFDFDPKTNIVETHMSRLRAKLNTGFERDAIETVRGAGYMMRSL
ncbi:Transcriptional regulatory protein CusR [Xanthomonas hydrangeae]|nr:Transcriptional regulatory protein CusR [Xanthomonas hydrangeae]CAD7716575.1 Transcriptional regulatory protein CusR [Xanthomonas hydrangeae]CAD7732064.1 Transcriptional regulatory protein CusR [Xanthomonas hydrangeae]CAD7732067.1 Transcriptional regulatory protein CusR [Xanthomonas hydrangeae]CAD7734992.1 Transcriptional regulatory protein CusR [Xanthomonas hydrangeae]